MPVRQLLATGSKEVRKNSYAHGIVRPPAVAAWTDRPVTVAVVQRQKYPRRYWCRLGTLSMTGSVAISNLHHSL